MILIKGGRVHFKNGEVKKTDILIEGRYIKKIDNSLNTSGAQVIDASGKEVFAGFIVPCTSAGLVDFTNIKLSDNNEVTDPITPQLNVKDALDKREILMQQYYYTGITAFGASPGTKNVISGQIGVYNTAGTTIKDMCIKEYAALKGNYIIDVKNAYSKKDQAPMTKMGIASIFKNTFIEAKEYMEKIEKSFNAKNEAIAKVLTREVPFLVNARTASEIQGIIDIAKQFNIRLVINDAYQPECCSEAIKVGGYPVILGQLNIMGYAVAYGTDLSAIAEMQKNDTIICVSNSGDNGMVGREPLLWSAIKMYQAGVSAEEVIKMMTINSAIALGVDNIIGSIEEEKQADIVIYNGHPIMSFEANVEYSLVAGEIVYARLGGFKKCCL